MAEIFLTLSRVLWHSLSSLNVARTDLLIPAITARIGRRFPELLRPGGKTVGSSGATSNHRRGPRVTLIYRPVHRFLVLTIVESFRRRLRHHFQNREYRLLYLGQACF